MMRFAQRLSGVEYLDSARLAVGHFPTYFIATP
jgi:hypothetical protein